MNLLSFNEVDLLNYYDYVEVIEGIDFTPDHILDRLATLSHSFIIDLHFLAHGSSTKIIGYEDLNVTNFFKPMKIMLSNNEMLPKIRTVYQQNSYGSGLNDEWIEAKVGIVAGPKGNNYMPLQYFKFLNYWINGDKTFNKCVELGYSMAKRYFEPIYLREFIHTKRITDSEMIVEDQTGEERDYKFNDI